MPRYIANFVNTYVSDLLRNISGDRRLLAVAIYHSQVKYLANEKHPIGFILMFPMPLTYRQHEGGSKFLV